MTDDPDVPSAATDQYDVPGDPSFLARLVDVDRTASVTDHVHDLAPEAVVYDLDGTLVRLLVDWQTLESDLAAMLAEAGLDDPGGDVWSRFEVAEAQGMGAEADALIAERERQGARWAVRLPAADLVAGHDVPVGVCSLNHESACHLALDAQDLADHVDAVVGRGTVAARKPDPAPLLVACSRLGVDPGETLFVGDSRSDAECADRAGALFRYVDGEPARER